jgi:cell division protein FtsW
MLRKAWRFGLGARERGMVSRAQRTPIGEWWWTVARLMLAAVGALLPRPASCSLTASPPVAGRLGLEPFYFVNRHILFLFPTIAILLAVSFRHRRLIRRLAVIVFAHNLIMVAATRFFGVGIKRAALAGAARRQHPARNF